jgi:hypothetical protein
MAVPPRDLPTHLDMIALLQTFDSPVADMVLRLEEAMLAPGSRSLNPEKDAPPEDDEVERFLLECDDRVATSTNLLSRTAAALPQSQLLSIPFFLGQPDWHGRKLSPGPNAFDYELGLLAQCRSEVEDVWDSHHFDDVLKSLRLARSVRLLHQLKRLARGDTRLADHFTTAWLFERGRFPGLYDLMIANRLRDELQNVGIGASDPRALRYFVTTALTHWAPVCEQFIDGLAADELATLREFSVLNEPKLTKAFQLRITQASQDMWFPVERLGQGLAADQATEVCTWLELATASLPIGTLELPAAYGVSPLRASPMIRSEHDQILLVAPHRFDTDLTDFLNAVWTEKHKENYFRARAKVNESTAFEVLMSLPGAVGISGGMYPGPAHGEVRECDGVVIWRGFCFVVEAKGGFVPVAARRGDHEAGRSAIRDSISEAYYQAARLVRTVMEDGDLDLVNGDDRLRLSASELTRFHIVIPVADNFGTIAVRTDILEELGLLPAGASPLVAAPQELMLFRDLLTTGVDWAAYFQFREEILTERPPIAFADELELVGAYVT